MATYKDTGATDCAQMESFEATTPEREFVCDTKYRKEAERVFLEYFEACNKALKEAGVQPPEWPELSQQVLDGLIANTLHGRWMVSFDHFTGIQLHPVQSGSWITNLRALPVALREMLVVKDDELVAIRDACEARLKYRGYVEPSKTAAKAKPSERRNEYKHPPKRASSQKRTA